MAEPTVQELQQQLTDLNKKLKEAGGLGIDLQEAFRNAGADTEKLNKYVTQLNKQYEDLVDNADYIYQTFRDISAELKNQNVLLKIGKSSFKGFTDIAQDLNSYQKGYNDLTDSKFKKLQNNLVAEKKELEFVVARLKAGENIRRSEVEALNALDERTPKEAARLKELLKENDLLVNAKEALKSGIPILENELNLTKQIANTRKDLGGLSQAAGKLISQYGGSLASFLNVSEATEAIEEFNKKLIQEALSTEKVKNDLLENERKKRLAEIGKDEAGNFITQEQAQERLITLEKEAYDIKKAAIASTDTLANKSQSLGILIKGLGEGFKKSLNDPFVQFTIGLKLVKSGFNDIKKAFNIFLEFDKVFTNTARGLGMSTDQVVKMTNAAKISGDQFGKNVYTAEQITKAIAESNAQLGLSVDLGANTTSEFAAMTNQMGLSAEEATNIYKLGLLNNMSLEDTNKTIASSIIATQKQTGVQVNARQVLQEIGKLSAGITSKFQQNPEALAKAVVQAKALGTNLEQVEKVGESLLNFESSIENELKAELLTGKQINVEKARYAALTGDQATLTAELADQVGSLGEFQEMNVLAQKSLAEAFGLSRDEVADMLTKQETFNKLGDVSKKSAAEQLALAKERGLSETDSLVVNLKQQATSEKIAAAFDNFKLAIASVLDSLKPVLDLMTSLSKHAWLVYTALGLMAGISLAKTIGGIALMITSLAAANIEAITLSTILTAGAFLVGLPLLLGAAYGIYKSATSSAKETAFASGGIVTGKITNATIGEAGPEAIIPLNSPKAAGMLGGIDISPLVFAINEVRNAVNALANKPQQAIALHVGPEKLGEIVGRQAETGTNQYQNAYQLA